MLVRPTHQAAFSCLNSLAYDPSGRQLRGAQQPNRVLKVGKSLLLACLLFTQPLAAVASDVAAGTTLSTEDDASWWDELVNLLVSSEGAMDDGSAMGKDDRTGNEDQPDAGSGG
ncbi:MAG: hypothetical protein R3F12_01410 [Lysobacteraceae bacterium]|nr:hypothetical protein [Planctomycetales bacterium]